MSEEEELLRRGLAGDRASFETVVAGYRERIYRYLLTMTGDDAAAEDLVQDAFRRAWANLAGFQQRSKFSTWLYQIAVNLTRNYFRDRASRAKHEGAGPYDEQTPDLSRRRTVLSSVVRLETAELLALAIDRLPDSLRESFTLHFIEHLDYDEIAQITGVAVGTLHARAYRARTLLRTQLGDVVDTFWTEEPKSE